jgi:hypothetical protein
MRVPALAHEATTERIDLETLDNFLAAPGSGEATEQDRMSLPGCCRAACDRRLSRAGFPPPR